MLLGGDKSRHLAIVTLPLPKRCELHPSFDADYCPVCGTARVIGERA